MEKYENEHGKLCCRFVTGESSFSDKLFHYPRWQPKERGEESLAFHSELGSLTVLTRRTGYTGSPLDTESGYRDPDGKFWLASGNQDVRFSGCETVGDAIDWVKSRANTVVGE